MSIRGSEWGDSIEKVRKTETGTLYHSLSDGNCDMLFYYGETYGQKSEIQYCFVDDQLACVTYKIKSVTDDMYKTYTNHIRGQQGEPDISDDKYDDTYLRMQIYLRDLIHACGLPDQNTFDFSLGSSSKCTAWVREYAITILIKQGNNDCYMIHFLPESMQETLFSKPITQTNADDDHLFALKAGVYDVGSEIPEGEYTVGRSIRNSPDPAYLFVLKDIEAMADLDNAEKYTIYGDVDLLLENGQLVYISSKDQDLIFTLTTKNAVKKEWIRKQGKAELLEAGKYEVGRDIEPGRYLFQPASSVTKLAEPITILVYPDVEHSYFDDVPVVKSKITGNRCFEITIKDKQVLQINQDAVLKYDVSYYIDGVEANADIKRTPKTRGLTYYDWKYDILDDNTVALVDYEGSQKRVSIPDFIEGKKVTALCDQALLKNHKNLTTVVIPKNLAKFEGDPFLSCSKLKSFEVSLLNQAFESSDGILFEKGNNTLLIYPPAKEGESYTVPTGISCIGEGAFCANNKLISVEIPETVTTIENGAFSSCKNLKSITIPNSVEIVSEYLFFFCDNLQTVYLPSTITSIEAGAFRGCRNLTTINIPRMTENIGKNAFEYCDSVIVTVDADSFAESYCIENNIRYLIDESTSLSDGN